MNSAKALAGIFGSTFCWKPKGKPSPCLPGSGHRQQRGHADADSAATMIGHPDSCAESMGSGSRLHSGGHSAGFGQILPPSRPAPVAEGVRFDPAVASAASSKQFRPDLEDGGPVYRASPEPGEYSMATSMTRAKTKSDPSQAASRAMSKKASTKNRHDAERLDYFLSHKKKHSKLGFMPEQVAKNIHDSLEILGHKGFLDIDDLDEISKDNVAACVAQCSTMIVYMNDETIESEWCGFEWQVAYDLNIPIKVIVDMTCCVKREVVDQVASSKFAYLLQNQWLEYSDTARRTSIDLLSRWMREVGRASAVDKRDMMYDDDGALCVRDKGETIPLFHPFFEFYMVACGLVYNLRAWDSRVIYWTRFIRFNAFACFGICLWRSIYATGPAYTDWYCSLFLLIVHAFLLHGLVYMVLLLSSDVMAGLLEHISSSSLGVWTSRRIQFISKWAAILGIVAASVQVRKFSELWSGAWGLQMQLQGYMNPVLCVHSVFNLIGLMIPLVYLMFGYNFLHRSQDTQPWTLWAKPILWVGFSMAVYSATIAIPTWTNFQLQGIVDKAKCLNMPPKDKEFLLVNLQMDLRWKFGPLRLTGLGSLLLFAVPLCGSLVCCILVGKEVAA